MLESGQPRQNTRPQSSILIDPFENAHVTLLLLLHNRIIYAVTLRAY